MTKTKAKTPKQKGVYSKDRGPSNTAHFGQDDRWWLGLAMYDCDYTPKQTKKKS